MSPIVDFNQAFQDSDGELREIVPPGEYAMAVTSVEPKDSKKGDAMTEVIVEINDGEYQGHQEYMYFLHPNPKFDARKNGFLVRSLKRFAIACKLQDVIKFQPDGSFDSMPFQGAQFKAVIGIQEETSEFPKSNKIKDYLPL